MSIESTILKYKIDKTMVRPDTFELLMKRDISSATPEQIKEIIDLANKQSKQFYIDEKDDVNFDNPEERSKKFNEVISYLGPVILNFNVYFWKKVIKVYDMLDIHLEHKYTHRASLICASIITVLSDEYENYIRLNELLFDRFMHLKLSGIKSFIKLYRITFKGIQCIDPTTELFENVMKLASKYYDDNSNVDESNATQNNISIEIPEDKIVESKVDSKLVAHVDSEKFPKYRNELVEEIFNLMNSFNPKEGEYIKPEDLYYDGKIVSPMVFDGAHKDCHICDKFTKNKQLIFDIIDNKSLFIVLNSIEFIKRLVKASGLKSSNIEPSNIEPSNIEPTLESSNIDNK
jgi:hypothetical protein